MPSPSGFWKSSLLGLGALAHLRDGIVMIDSTIDTPLPMPLALNVALLSQPDRLSRWEAELLRAIAGVAGLYLILLRIEGSSALGSRRRILRDRCSAHRGRSLRDPAAEELPRDLRQVFVRDSEIPAALADVNPDVVIDLTGRAAIARLASSPRYGRWSLELTDSPAGGDTRRTSDVIPRSGVAIVSMVAQVEPLPVVLREAALPVVPYSYVKTLLVLQRATVRWPADCLAWLRDYGSLPASPPSEVQAQTPFAPIASRRARPPLRAAARTKAHNALEWVRHLVDHLLWSDMWAVGVAHADIAAFVEGAQERIEWLPESGQTSTYHADPFGIVTNSATTTILAESFDYSVGRGTLQSLQVRAGGRTEWSADLNLAVGTHISYPYLLCNDDAIYCVPETHQAREIALYRATSFPLVWEKDTVLVADFAGVDPTIVQVAGRWWLFATDHDADAWSVLHAWWATGLRGPWHPHARNPIKVDARSSRPAGTPYVSSRRLLRPAQDNSSSYGARIVVNRVTSLSPTRFAEDPVAVVEPSSSWPWPNGIHTITALGHETLFDAKKRAIVPVASFHKAIVLLRLAYRSLTSRSGG